MSPLAVFLRTLARSSAIFLGAGAIFLHPSLEWRGDSRAVVGALQAPRDAAIDGLIAALQDTDAAVRRQAVVALGELGSARAASPVADLLKDPQPAVRAAAARTLEAIDARQAVPALTAAMSDANASVRRAVVSALGALGDAAALDALTRALKDEDASVRRAAASAIAEIGGDGPVVHPHPRPRPRPHPRPIGGFGVAGGGR